MRIKFLFCINLFLGSTLFAQKHEDLPYYYPNNNFWPLEIRVIVHVMQYSADDARNFTKYDTADIHEIMGFVNRMYNELGPPSRPVPDVISFPSSNIKFAVQGVYFHVDSVGWKIDYVEPKLVAPIISFNSAENKITVKGGNFRVYTKKEGLNLKYKNGKRIKFTADTVFVTPGLVHIIPNEKIDTVGIDSVGFNNLVNNNCWSYNFDKYARILTPAIHIFFTKSTTSNIMFGCGPGKNYLNMSNVYKAHTWAAAQLISHEIGHCLGLSHTDYPQFPDLPKNDKFGWINCDNSEVSNNIMGYNICRNYLSPMQIANVHRTFNTKPDYINISLNKNYDPNRLMRLDSSLTLNRNLVINGDILIKRGRTFKINSIAYITENTKIILEDKAQLIIDGGALSVLDKKSNANIIYCRRFGSSKKPKKKGTIKAINNGKIIGLQNI